MSDFRSKEKLSDYCWFAVKMRRRSRARVDDCDFDVEGLEGLQVRLYLHFRCVIGREHCN